LGFDDSYLDLTVDGNRRAFLLAHGQPAGVNATQQGFAVYLPCRTTNLRQNIGTGGDFNVGVGQSGTTQFPIDACHAWSTGFDDTDDPAVYLGSDPAGLADGKAFTLLGWCRYVPGTQGRFLAAGHPNYVQAALNADTFDIELYNAANTRILRATYTFTSAPKVWHQIALSVDLASTGSRHLLFDGVDVTGSVTWTDYTNDTADLTRGSWAVGGDVAAGPVFGTHYDGQNAQVLVLDESTDLSDSQVKARIVNPAAHKPRAVALLVDDRGTTANPTRHLPTSHHPHQRSCPLS